MRKESVELAKGVDVWWRKWCSVNGECDGAREESEEVITKSRMWVFVVGRKIDVLTQVERGEKRQKLGSEVICGIIKINIKVSDGDEFMRHGRSKIKERIKVFKKNGEWFRKGG